MVNAGWRDALRDPPKDKEDVLCVKETKNGTRSLCFGRFIAEREIKYDNGWVTTGSCNNVIAWQPLPKVPQPGELLLMKLQEDDDKAQLRELRERCFQTEATLEQFKAELKGCANELCYKCGSYKHEHEGACDGCRFRKARSGDWSDLE